MNGVNIPVSPRRRIVVIDNPASGRHRPDQLAAMLAALERSRAQLFCRHTSSPGDAATLVSWALAQAPDIVVASGGDGTIHEVVDALMQVRAEKRPRLAILPFGTANVLAGELGLAPDPQALAAMVLDGRPVLIDVGRVAGPDRERRFIACAGAGADAAAIDRVPPALKRAAGRGAYAFAALSALASAPVPLIRGAVDGRPFVASAVLVSNVRNYAGPRFAIADARMDDGELDVLIAAPGGRVNWVGFGLRLLFGDRLPALGVRHLRARRIELREPDGLAVQLDGDIRTRLPLCIEVEPAALVLLTPAVPQSRASSFQEVTTDRAPVQPCATAPARLRELRAREVAVDAPSYDRQNDRSSADNLP